MKPHHVAIALSFLLIAGIVLIAHGAGVLTGRSSVGVAFLGVAISWIALRLLDQVGGRWL